MSKKLPAWMLVGRILGLLFIATRSVISRCPEPCNKPLGISDGRIRDDQMSASSAYDNAFETFGAHRARLNLTTWPAGYRANIDALDDFTWIKIKLDQDMVITGIATQGYGNASFSEWVSSYLIFFEKEGVKETASCTNTDGEPTAMCNGNVDSSSIQYHNLATPAVTKSITVNPFQWKDNVGLRMELYGCEPEFHFVAVMTIWKTRFKLDYANSTTESYLTMRDDVIAEVTDLLRDVSGFLFADLRTLSPHSGSKKLAMAAEVQIYCIQSRKAAVAQELKISLRSGFSSMLGEFLYLEELFNCQCDVPSVKVELRKTLEDAVIIHTNSRFLLKATYKGDCKRYNSGSYELHWEVSKCEESTGFFNQMIPYGKNKPGRPKYLFPRLFGVGYLYIRCVLKNHFKETITYDYGYVRITHPPLVAKIDGPSRVLMGNESFVILDGSASYDPEERHKKANGLSFTWFCRREGVLQKDKDEISTVYPNDTRVCHGTETRHLNSSMPMLTLDLGRSSGNNTYVFELLVQKGDRLTRTTHKLYVEPPFQLFFGCTTNCGAKVSANRRLTIRTSCSGLLCDRIAKYSWLLFKLKSNGEDWLEVPSFEEKILTDIDSPYLVIPGDEQLLEKSSKYKLRTIVALSNKFTLTEEFIFLTNSPPRAESDGGGCSVIPAEGFVLTTEFNISCFGWLDDDLPLTYDFRYHTSSGVLVINSGLKPYTITRLPLGNITLEARVSDFMNASAIERFQVQVKPIPAKDISKVLETSTSDGNNSLQGLINEKNFDEAAQMAYSIVTAVKEANIGSEDKQRVKEAVLEQISVVEINSMQQITQLSAVVVVATEEEKGIDVSVQENAVGLLENMTEFITSRIGTEAQNVDLVRNIGGNLLQGISNSLSASAKKAVVFEQNTLLDKKGSEDVIIDLKRKQNKKIVKKVLHLIDKLASGLLETKVPGEKPSVYYTDKLMVTLDRQTPQKMSGKTVGEGEGKATLPPANILFEADMANMKYVDAQITSFDKNPFTWDMSAKGIQSKVVEFTLKNDGTSLNISGLQEPIELFIPVTRTDPKGENRSLKEYFVKPSDGFNNLRYHRIDIPSPDSKVSFEIRPEEGQFLEIFVAAQRKPTSTDFQFNIRLPNYASCSAFSEAIGYYNCSINPYEVSLSSDVTGKTGLHYIGIMHSSNEAEKSPSRVLRSCRNGGRRQKRSCIGVKDPPTLPPPTPLILAPKYNRSTDVNYTMSVTVTSCLYWSESKQIWTNEGCSIGPKTKSASLHCLCNHLSAFGGDFFVAPNPIDFDKVWENFGKLRETGNYVVLATVCSIFGLYIMGLVLSRRADKIDELKAVGNVVLNDSTTSGCVYNVHVQTGMWTNQGTTAQVGIALYGEEGCSGPISLSDSKARKILFARGSLNSFTFALPTSLGRLFKILIWHDNSGEDPAWFLQQIQVEDTSSGDIWHFLANRWLALEKGSGEIEYEINAANKYELRKFKNLFVFRTAKNLGDGHLWLSVLTRPPHVAFTRCQRLSCCLSVLFTAMVTNAMFYNFGASPKDSFQVGPLKLSWTQIKIGIQSSLIAIPINVLAALIFRNIKQKPSENVFDIRENEPKEKVPGCLPHFFIYIGWTICILTSLTSAAFIVFYSMMWGKETSNQWLTSVTVSFIQDVFVSQPIKVILLASLLSLIIRKPPDREKVCGITYHKGYSSDKTVAKPPQGVELEKARDYRAKVKGMYNVLSEITLFLTFFLLLLIVCYGNRSPSRYVLTTSMEDAFRNFKGRNISSFWTWIRSRLLPALYDTKWYNGWTFDYDEGFLRNRELFMVGMPRLRQIRIKPASVCVGSEKTPQLGTSFTRCIPSYSPKREYKTPYNLPEWIPVTKLSDDQSVFELERLCPKPWRYKTSWDLKTLSYEGFYRTYDGGGYVADLGYNIRSALGVVKELQTNNWMDEFSTAIFVEFTIFNPSSSLFSVAKCLYERFPTGGVVFSKSVRTLTLYSASNNNYQTFHEVCQLLFMVLILFLIINEMSKIYRERKKYFTNFWNWMELIQILTAICSVVMYFLKAKYTSWFIRKVRNNPFETSSADYIVLWSAVEIYVLSFLIFIVTIKFLRLIRFNRHVCQMLGTLARAVNPLFSYSVVFISTVLAYTQLGFLLFGSTMLPYSSFLNSLRAVLQMLLGGRMYFYEIKSVNGILGPLFIFLYMLTMAFILLNMFIAILNDSYFQVVEIPQNEFADADLGEFMISYLIRKMKLRGRRLVSSFKTTKKSRASRCRSKERKYVIKEKYSSEIQRLFTVELQTEITATCPIASIESFTEDLDDTDRNENTYKISEQNGTRAVIDSGNISLSSLLSIDEAFESDEDGYLEEVLLNVKSASYSSEFVLRVSPLRPIVETNV